MGTHKDIYKGVGVELEELNKQRLDKKKKISKKTHLSRLQEKSKKKKYLSD